MEPLIALVSFAQNGCRPIEGLSLIPKKEKASNAVKDIYNHPTYKDVKAYSNKDAVGQHTTKQSY